MHAVTGPRLNPLNTIKATQAAVPFFFFFLHSCISQGADTRREFLLIAFFSPPSDFQFHVHARLGTLCDDQRTTFVLLSCSTFFLCYELK